MNNTIRTLQSIIDRNTNKIRDLEDDLHIRKNVQKMNKFRGSDNDSEWYKNKIRSLKSNIKRKANEQRVLKKLIADEIEIANFNRKFEWEGIV